MVTSSVTLDPAQPLDKKMFVKSFAKKRNKANAIVLF